MSTGHIRNVFVGRRREMAQLEAALSEALSGQGRMVMVAGEPGIGKTRTAQELASYAGGARRQGPLGLVLRRRGRPTLLALGLVNTIGTLIDTNGDPQTPIFFHGHRGIEGLQDPPSLFR